LAFWGAFKELQRKYAFKEIHPIFVIPFVLPHPHVIVVPYFSNLWAFWTKNCRKKRLKNILQDIFERSTLSCEIDHGLLDGILNDVFEVHFHLEDILNIVYIDKHPFPHNAAVSPQVMEKLEKMIFLQF